MSKALNKIYLSKTDLVEPFGIDESWLDVTNSAHLFGSGKFIADSLRKEVKEALGITISVGVSFNKVFAKLGSDYKKPDATTEITRENMRQMVWGMPVESLIFVGGSAQKSLQKINITTIGDLAAASRETLVKIMGKQGEMLFLYANGLDSSPVRSYFEQVLPKSVGNGMTFKRNLLGEEDLKVAVFILCGEVSERLKDVGLFANGLSVSLKDPDFKVKNRQCILPSSTQSEGVLRKCALDLAVKNTDLKKPLRAVTITAINLTPDSIKQTSLFGDDSDREKQERLENAVACLKKKMGNGVLESATVLASDLNEVQALKGHGEGEE
ncbi:MAG: DNA polymerase IV, partial [Oscillospiraceae bacterium]